jgi:hypothetical protein
MAKLSGEGLALAARQEGTERELERRYDELYERYRKPLEAEHRGNYLAISTTGQTLIASTLREAELQGVERLGPGIFVYCIGAPAVGRIG